MDGYQQTHSSQSKTKGMLFGRRQKLDKAAFDVILSGNKIERVSKFEYLGVTLDDQLSWKDHITSLSRKASKRLGILAHIRTPGGVLRCISDGEVRMRPNLYT